MMTIGAWLYQSNECDWVEYGCEDVLQILQQTLADRRDSIITIDAK